MSENTNENERATTWSKAKAWMINNPIEGSLVIAAITAAATAIFVAVYLEIRRD